MLAIGSYAQTEDPWVEKTKASLIKAYPYYADYINVRPDGKMIYVHQFSFDQGPEGNHTRKFLTKNSAAMLNRTMENGIVAHFACVFKGDPEVPVEQRPEYKLTFSSYLEDTYDHQFYSEALSDHNSAKNAMLDAVAHSSTSGVGHAEVGRGLTRGGEYILKAENNAGNGHQLEFTLQSNPECRMDVEGGSYMGEEAKVKIFVASGYPYTVENYQGKTMTLEVFDAEDKKLKSIPFELNASVDSTRLEYMVQFEYKFYLEKSKYTFKFSGDILDNDIVIVKNVKSYTEKLQATIEEAIAFGDRILNNPTLSFFAFKADQLKDLAEDFKPYLDLPASTTNQYVIEQSIGILSQQIASVEAAIEKGFVQVYNATELKGEIAKDPTVQIQLMRDIDMSDMTSKLGETFKGFINGRGYKGETYALIGRYQRPEFDNQQSSYLFENTDEADFANIIFKNFLVKDLEDAKPNLGVISRTAHVTHYRNIKMENVYVHGYEENVGTVTGSASYCVFDKVNISNTIVFTDDECGGGIAGNTERCIFTDCQTEPSAAIYTDGSSRRNAYSGGFTGYSKNDGIKGCINQALVCANEINLGGIVGLANATYISDCCNYGRIVGCDGDKFWKIQRGELQIADLADSDIGHLGGICGYAEYGSIERCINDGVIIGKTTGGIVGMEYGGVIINNCLNKILNASLNGAIVGSSNDAKVTNCLSTVDCKLVGGGTTGGSSNNYSLLLPNSKRTTRSIEMGVSQEQLRSGIVARWLNNGYNNRKDGVEPWRQNVELQDGETEVDLHPVLDPSHRVVTTELLTRGTEIKNYEDLIAFATRVNNGDQFACAYLSADINMYHVDWTPIGKNEDHKHFRGIFDGRGHTITGLKCTGNNNEPVGLFGAVHANAEICNVTVGEGSEFVSAGEGQAGAGGIVGRVALGSKWTWGNVIIENCGSYANIVVDKHGGGILGRVSTDVGENKVKVFVNNCYSVGTVTATNGNSGLLCGYMKDTGVVSGCWSVGKLIAKPVNDKQTEPYSIENPKDQGEYLVGYNQELEIKDCFLTEPSSHIDMYDNKKYPIQDGVKVVSDKAVRSGELCYILNKGVTDGTQLWYQNTRRDPYPVRIKEPNGVNMVYRIVNSEGFIDYDNTSYQEIVNIILHPTLFNTYPATDVNGSGDVDVTDLTTFTEAANK